MIAVAAALSAGGGAARAQPSGHAGHALDELTAAEIRATIAVLRSAGHVGPRLRFGAVELHEPTKAQVAQDAVDRASSHRAADVVAYDWAAARGYHGSVDLHATAVTRWDTLPLRRPPSVLLVVRRVEEAVAGDPRWTRALRRHGFTDPARVAVFAVPQDTMRTAGCAADHQCVTASVNVRDDPPPADEIPGLRIEVDLTDARVLAVDDRGPAAMPRVDAATAAALRHPPVERARAADAGPACASSIRRRGSEIRWGRWRVHAGVHPRRGLELWDVEIEDGGRWRSVLYRAALVDMVAPYGDPAFGSFAPNDEKAFGLVTYTRNELVAGGDAPVDACFLDAVVPDAMGRPLAVPRAAALYETTDGVLWRHANDARLARRLVLTSVATIDNYDYAFSWILSPDGTIDVDVRLTGIMNVEADDAAPDGMAADDGAHAHRHRVAAHVFAPNHQHFFSYRLDFDIDGAAGNRVVETDAAADPIGPGNVDGEWFSMRSRVLRSEREARRPLDAAASRRWRVENPHAPNALGEPAAYTLLPAENAMPYAAPSSAVRRREPYLDASLWVTPVAADEMYPAGSWPSAPDAADDLAAWTRADRPIADADVVLWYTLGVTHLPRPEDFPFMAAYRTGFRLVPTGFFDRNPALR